MEEEREPNEMEPSSIFDQFPVTLGDSEEIEEVTVEEESQVTRATDQTAAGEEEEGGEGEEKRRIIRFFLPLQKTKKSSKIPPPSFIKYNVTMCAVHTVHL